MTLLAVSRTPASSPAQLLRATMARPGSQRTLLSLLGSSILFGAFFATVDAKSRFTVFVNSRCAQYPVHLDLSQTNTVLNIQKTPSLPQPAPPLPPLHSTGNSRAIFSARRAEGSNGLPMDRAAGSSTSVACIAPPHQPMPSHNSVSCHPSVFSHPSISSQTHS